MLYAFATYAWQVVIGADSLVELPQLDPPLSRTALHGNRSYIVDAGALMFVWHGRKASKLSRNAGAPHGDTSNPLVAYQREFCTLRSVAVTFASGFVDLAGRPPHTRIIPCAEGHEPYLLRSLFPDWHDGDIRCRSSHSAAMLFYACARMNGLSDVDKKP